ncbi:Peptidase S24/S26A/S26B/S26C family protein [Striga hermonthica]|uniref:Peptidase S24/S26A/S26B/S26C family protein n=1 Tax=Striga hermonthica TaxID=68872 RepID=A0A9N7MZV1_STRHE|nr:Peptidase S24/S26A/S26B/S26C family protein [Striga hermonthica]
MRPPPRLQIPTFAPPCPPGEETRHVWLQGMPISEARWPPNDERRRNVGGYDEILKDPTDSDKYIVRRLAAIEGYEMVSSDESDEPFILDKNHCWVTADNENLKPKESHDSRTFGPVNMTSIVGRVIYYLRNAVDHGPVNNSDFSAVQDSPVLAMELDVDEMMKNYKDN